MTIVRGPGGTTYKGAASRELQRIFGADAFYVDLLSPRSIGVPRKGYLFAVSRKRRLVFGTRISRKWNDSHGRIGYGPADEIERRGNTEHREKPKRDKDRASGKTENRTFRFGHANSRQEAIPSPGNGLYQARVVGIVPHRIAEPFDGGVKAMVEIYKGVRWPQSAAKLFSGNHLAWMFEQHAQDLERLFLYFQLDSILA
jgi:hypothetical protein